MSVQQITLQIASLPDRDFLTCELWNGEEQLAEVRIELDGLAVEIYPRRSGKAWDVSYNELSAALARSKEILSEIDTSVIV